MVGRMKVQSVCDELDVSAKRVHPKPNLAMHSDRGSQCDSERDCRLPKKHGPQVASSGRASARARLAENFFRFLKEGRTSLASLYVPIACAAGCA